MSHLGRPKVKKDLQFMLKPAAEHLSKLLKKRVQFVSDCVGPEAVKVVKSLKNGEVALLENLRFYAEEEKNDREFSKSLAELADLYVEDAFGAVHRAHASTVGVTAFLPSACGLLLE